MRHGIAVEVLDLNPQERSLTVGRHDDVLGAGLLMLPASSGVAVSGIILLGLGTSPIFPSMLHETPRRFGTAASQAVMGLQMAFAYAGSTCFPPLLGALADRFSVGVFPYFVMACAVTMLIASERLRGKLQTHRPATAVA